MKAGYYWLTKSYSDPIIVHVQGEMGGKLFYEVIGRKGVFYIEPATTKWKLEGPIVYNH